MLTKKEFQTVTQGLIGISYHDWQKVKMSVDAYFQKEIRNCQDKLVIADSEELADAFYHATFLRFE